MGRLHVMSSCTCSYQAYNIPVAPIVNGQAAFLRSFCTYLYILYDETSVGDTYYCIEFVHTSDGTVCEAQLPQHILVTNTTTQRHNDTAAHNTSTEPELLGLGTSWLGHYRLCCGKNPSVYWTAAVSWPSEASNAEHSSANSPPPAREGAPLEAPAEAKKMRIFASFPITIGLKLYWPGVVAVIYTEQIKKKSRKIRATCGDDVTFFMLLVFVQVHYKSFWRTKYQVSYLMFIAIPSLLPFGHRVVGSHQQTKHKKAQTKIRKQNEKQCEETKER